MGDRRSVDDFQSSKAHASQTQDYIDHNNLLSGMRWLYEDDVDYEKAKRKMASEIYREEVKKLLAKKTRTENTKQLTDTLKQALRTPRALCAYVLKQKKMLFGISGVTAVLILAVFFFSNRSSENPIGLLGTKQGSPAYDALLPGDSVENTSSGKVSYDEKRQLITYTDHVGSVSATVSQQPLPEKFQQDPKGELFNLAKKVGAKESLTLNGNTIYLSPPEQNMKWFVFIKDQLLVFITSAKQLDRSQLMAYINSLQ